MSTSPDPEATLLASIPKAPDLVTHVRRISFPQDGITVIELRDFVPSTGQYGRGYWLPMEAIQQLHFQLGEIPWPQS